MATGVCPQQKVICWSRIPSCGVGEAGPFLHIIKSVPRGEQRHCYVHRKPSCSCFILALVLALQIVSYSDCRPTSLLSVGLVEHYGTLRGPSHKVIL